MSYRSNSTSCVASDGAEVVSNDVILQTTPEGRIQASRNRKDRERNPDRICLDRRGLTQLPVLVGEPRLRLLSLQHNLITRLDCLASQGLARLVFLDLYDNQLERVAGLDTLTNLRVLLMGKNRIRRIEGLNSLSKLEVLDFHGNQIYQVGGLSALGELKVLNLAGNQIRVIGIPDLQGLRSLQELNLRRNRIKRLLGFGETPQLQKLFLSNNELHTVDNMCSLVKATQLREITVDGNPVALGGDCVSFLVSHLPLLKLLSRMEVTPAVRQAATAWRNGRGPGDSKREEVISNARTNWELLRSETLCPSMTSLSCSLKDLRSEVDFEPSTERHVQSDSGLGSTGSTVSTNPAGPERFLTTRSYVPSRADKKRLNFTRRTVSQDSDGSQLTTTSNPTVAVEFFRLPPILAALSSNGVEKSSTAEATMCDMGGGDVKRCDSLSSVEPNVDSSLSSLPSDSSNSNGSTSGEESETSPEPELVVTPQEEPARTVKSATHYRKHAPRRNQPRATTSRPQKKTAGPSGGDFLVEISGSCLNVYGQGAIRFIDRPWSSGKAADVMIVKFNYVNFNTMIPILSRIKQRFPNAENFIFCETNINCLGQLNALADIQGLTSLTIEPEGNPITNKDWKKYAVYRLSHWGLKIINDTQITEEEVVAASEEFQGLSDIVLWSLPDSLLQPLLNKLHLEGNRSGSQLSAKQWLWEADPALRSVVGKEALQWRRGTLTQEDMMWRHRGRAHLAKMLEVACSAVEKLCMLQKEWPGILSELIKETLVDYSQIDSYMKKCMQNLRL